MDLLGARSLPFLARRSYYYEVQHLLPWSVIAGLVEGQFASVIVSSAFHAGPLLITIASTTPMAAFLTSLYWGMLSVGRPKIRLLTLFVLGSTLCAGGVGLIPSTPVGAVWFVAQVAIAQALLAGVVTVRSAVWRANYPRASRGQITARLQRLRQFASVATALVAARLCDREPDAYRIIFPVAALFGLIGVVLLRRIRVRGERRDGRERFSDADVRRGLVEPFTLTALMSPGRMLGNMAGILRRDARFRTYCVAQTLTGIANLMTIPIVVTLLTRDLNMDDHWAFWVSTTLIVALPNLTMLGSVTRWGSLFDRVGVVRMRLVNVTCWTLSHVLAFGGAIVVLNADAIGPCCVPIAVALFAGRGVLNGLGIGGGQIAWHIGHLHFARPEEAELYMGVHVSLTGMRALVAPFAGMWLWYTVGWPVWLLAIASSTASFAVYALMARTEPREMSN